MGSRVQNIYSKSDNYGKKGTIVGFCPGKNCTNVQVKYDDGGCGESGGYNPALNYYKLISGSESNKVAPKRMNLLAKLAQSLMSEPEKTFRKLEITNGDNMLTCEGKELFINWLFQKNKDAFKTEVADDMLAEQEKENAK